MTDEILQCDVAKEDISAYLDGELSGIDAARIEAHLKRCSDCARELELLKEGGKLVRELGERRPSEELERILQRRSRDYLDGFMARRRRSRMVFAARIWARKAIAAALLLAVAGGAVYGVVWLWQTKRADVERAPRTASVDEPLGAREKATEPSRVRPLVGRKPAEREPRELLETVSRETSASYYSGWWNVSYGAPPADIGFAKLMHDGNTVAILGDTYVSGHGTLEGRRMLISQVNTARETGLQLEAEFDVAGRNFAGTAVLSYGGGQYQYPVAIFGEKLAPELATILDAQGKAAETVAQRDDRLKKVYAALKRYAQERDGALPVELSELLPNYLDDESLVTGEPGIRDVAYEGGLSIPQPRTRTVDMPSELAADEALSVRAESSEGSLDPFFTELMSESWKMAPRGRAILYLDGTTRWEEDPASKPPLPPVLVEHIEREQMLACQENLKQLGVAFERWLREWEDRYPLTLEMLYPDWLTDPRVLTCPAARSRTICYEFLCPGETRPVEEEFASPEDAHEYYATTPLAIELGEPHLDGHNVLYVDGHVEWHPASERY